MTRKTRLSRYTERKQKKTLFLSILGIIVLLFLLFKFGLPALINLSLFIAGNKGTPLSEGQNKLQFIPYPIFNASVSATNSAKIKVAGKAEEDSNVELYQNAKKIDQQDTDSEGKFEFEVVLNEEENTFTARQVIDNKKSDFSSPLVIIFKKSPPSLEITNQNDGDSFKKEDKVIEVTGTTDANTTVMVSGFYAIIDESNSFSYFLTLHDGDNEIKVASVDLAGNRAEKIIHVNYSP